MDKCVFSPPISSMILISAGLRIHEHCISESRRFLITVEARRLVILTTLARASSVGGPTQGLPSRNQGPRNRDGYPPLRTERGVDQNRVLQHTTASHPPVPILALIRCQPNPPLPVHQVRTSSWPLPLTDLLLVGVCLRQLPLDPPWTRSTLNSHPCCNTPFAIGGPRLLPPLLSQFAS